ncbi:MAG: hypothetical protein U9Q79_04570 [Candidatus Hydrogenedentes bacterium]|nr:hypothetical protein [Candidatus Hydrogenedentota bacterium]
MAAAKSSVQKLLDLAGQFIAKQKGNWDHGEWEAFLTKAEALGVPVDDDGKRNLGNILEAGKYFYTTMPKPAAKKRAAARKRAPKR